MTASNRTDVELMYRRLSAVEAKWFTRLILKSYQPLVLDPHLIYRLCDPLLPCVLKVQDDFATAITTAQTLRRGLLPNSGQQTPREQIMSTVKPQLGIKIGRQPWIKGRSIKHCLDMGHGRMSVEEKIDGEYCQIHIDPSKGDRCIQIFSKSGKDSTEDRVALHGEVVTYSNPEPVAPADNKATVLKQAPGVEQGSPPTAIFTRPLVFDLKCFSFDRVCNTGFWSLRFPSVTKVHFDRDFTDTISFEQLQKLAKDATTAAELEDNQENLQWIAKLEAADPRGVAVDAASQLTVTTMPTPSPRKSTQNTTSTWSPASSLAKRSPVGNIISPCRDRLERLRPLFLSTAAATLPTTAAPLASPTEHRAQKHDPLIVQQASPHKRPRLDSESPPKHKHIPESTNNYQPRGPLTGIDDNPRSQPVMTTCASPSTSFASDDPNSDENDASIFVADFDCEDDIRSGNDLETETELCRDIPAKKIFVTNPHICAYAGENCVFAKAEMLISPGLLSNSKARTLLELHGIGNPVEKIDAWLKREQSGKLKKTKNSAKIFLLCQSDDKEATKFLFDKIQKVRETIPHERQNWINVYDWRVLHHVTIQEDDAVQPKYYDGFHTPWERWRIGPGLI
ncbi:hypothetical protein ACHAPD_009267 [Fusarium lateritium]